MLRNPAQLQVLQQPSHEETELIAIALERAQRAFKRTQRPDGTWESMGELGSISTSQVVIGLHWVGALSPEDGVEAARFLRSQQLPDGGYVLHPYAEEGNLGATACAWAAMTVGDPAGSAEAIGQAKAWIDARGGILRVIALMDQADVSAVFLALAGLVDAKQLPCPMVRPLLFPGALPIAQRRVHSGVLMVAQQISLIVRRLRGDFGPDGTKFSFFERAEAAQAVELMETFQNTNGSWNENTVQGALALPALVCAGLSKDDHRLVRGIDWMLGQRERDATGLRFNVFGSAVWTTAFNIQALMDAGMPPSGSRISRALSWLVDAQLTIPQPPIDNRNPGMPLTGGWGFQKANHTMADCDDAGVVLFAFGQALAATGEDALEPSLRARVERSVEKGVDWLRGMQNPDGGWSAFVWNLPARRYGPLFEKTPTVKMDDFWAMTLMMIDPPRELGDCSVEDATSRILFGLGLNGYTLQDPMVSRAVEFIKSMQMANGSFYGRWGVNYLTATPFVLMGLKAVGVDMNGTWVRNAVRWMLSKQNPDGGWGETHLSYAKPTEAGEGPSTAPLTGLVLQGLMAAGVVEHEAVKKGIGYLLEQQLADGTWSNGTYLHSNLPPDTFYVLPEAARFYPTRALALYLTTQPGSDTPPAPMFWDKTFLNLMRQETDIVADQVARDLYADGNVEAVNQLMGAIFRSDAPIPPDLPEAAKHFFEETADLPEWADKKKIVLAQKLFIRAGWQVSAGLFCSALPQAYAAAKGAHVLTQTQGMTKHIHQRIFETAQFLFDVLDVGGLEPRGRGIRATQKIRLLHGGIRQLIWSRTGAEAWNAEHFGQPVNQEDLAGTLMTFGCVTLDAVERLGETVSEEEGEAWIHFWNVVGHLLGIRRDLLPRDRGDAEALMDAIRDRQWGISRDGAVLIRPLVEMMQKYIPGKSLDGLPVALIRRLAGEQCADLLGLPPSDWTRVLLDVGLEIGKNLGGLTPNERDAKVLAWASHLLMRGMVTHEREGKQAKFRLPTSLKDTIDPNG